MNMNEYQSKALVTAIFPGRGSNPVYPMLGLCGEAGEAADRMKKAMRDKNGDFSLVKDEMKMELGDILWYMAVVADEMGLTLAEIAEANIAKVMDRMARDKIHGDGDNR